MFADDYVVVKIDIEEMTNGGAIAQELRGDGAGGIPWITVLDSMGRELITSDSPDGNIGCPISEAECDYFVSMIEMTIQHASRERITAIAEALDAYADQRR